MEPPAHIRRSARLQEKPNLMDVGAHSAQPRSVGDLCLGNGSEAARDQSTSNGETLNDKNISLLDGAQQGESDYNDVELTEDVFRTCKVCKRTVKSLIGHFYNSPQEKRRTLNLARWRHNKSRRCGNMSKAEREAHLSKKRTYKKQREARRSQEDRVSPE